MTAQTRIAEFAAGTGNTGFFPNISRAEVVQGLRERVADPKTQNTAHVNLCGPAALFYCVLNDNPEVYIKYVIDLYTGGSARLGTLTIRPGTDCRNCRPNPDKIAPIDWIALASLRDSENTILDYNSVDDGAAGITMPHTLADWFTAVGYQQIRNETNVFFSKGRSEIDATYILHLQGRRVCLFINANMLYADKNTNRSLSPDHWVVLTSPAGVSNDNIAVKVYSWGKIYEVPPQGTLPVDSFSRNFYGYVSAWFPH
jgi:hypothetical protein